MKELIKILEGKIKKDKFLNKIFFEIPQIKVIDPTGKHGDYYSQIFSEYHTFKPFKKPTKKEYKNVVKELSDQIITEVRKALTYNKKAEYIKEHNVSLTAPYKEGYSLLYFADDEYGSRKYNVRKYIYTDLESGIEYPSI